MNLVAFIDDDDDFRKANIEGLELAGFEPIAYASAQRAVLEIGPDFGGIVVTDIRMPGMDGLTFFQRLQAIDPDLPVILITGHGDIDQAVSMLKSGAYDFIAKPFSSERLAASVSRALEKRRLVLENRGFREEALKAQAAWPIIGASHVMTDLRSRLKQIAEADVDTLIEGEMGVGKELAARALHALGPRRDHRFVTVSCAALPAKNIESELFGHELGAFNGAVRTRVGLIEYADRGTLFLDDVDALPPASQARLLRVVAEREVTRLGTNETRPINVRFVAATTLGLTQALDTGAIRPDLFHRLDIGRIRVPPLRERTGDIPLLFAHFVAAAADRRRIEPPPMDDQTRQHLAVHDWPGNVRELANYAERFVLGLGPQDPASGTKPLDLKSQVDQFEAEVIEQALTASKGRVKEALERLQLPRKTFYDKVQKHGIDLDRYRRTSGAMERWN